MDVCMSGIDTIDQTKGPHTHDPSQPLPDKRRERTAQLHADGIKLSVAWSQTANGAITKDAAYGGASRLRNEPEFMSRVEHLRKKYTECTSNVHSMHNGMVPDLDTMAGREQVLKDMIESFYTQNARPEAVRQALSELIKLKGDLEQAELDRRKLDPVEVTKWLLEAELDGRSPAQVIAQEHDGLKTVAKAVKCTLGVHGVLICTQTESAKAGTLHTSEQPTDNAATMESIVKHSVAGGCEDNEGQIASDSLSGDGGGQVAGVPGPPRRDSADTRSVHPRSTSPGDVAHCSNGVCYEEEEGSDKGEIREIPSVGDLI